MRRSEDGPVPFLHVEVVRVLPVVRYIQRTTSASIHRFDRNAVLGSDMIRRGLTTASTDPRARPRVLPHLGTLKLDAHLEPITGAAVSQSLFPLFEFFQQTERSWDYGDGSGKEVTVWKGKGQSVETGDHARAKRSEVVKRKD